MLAWVLLVANYADDRVYDLLRLPRLQGKAAMGLVRRVGGARRHRRAADARRRARTTARMAIVSEKGRTQSGPRRKISIPGQLRP
jgi:hypothetical protein